MFEGDESNFCILKLETHAFCIFKISLRGFLFLSSAFDTLHVFLYISCRVNDRRPLNRLKSVKKGISSPFEQSCRILFARFYCTWSQNYLQVITRLHHKSAFYLNGILGIRSYMCMRVFSFFCLMRVYDHCRLLVSALTRGIIKRREKLQIVLYSLLGRHSYEVLYSVINSIGGSSERHFAALRLYCRHLNVSHPLPHLHALFSYSDFFTSSSSSYNSTCIKN